jgi:uncharacterized protein (DUF2267 family)
MPFPIEYSRARDHFYDFLADVRERAAFGSSHQTYTMVQGVFQTFRRRLEIKEAIIFSNILPVGLRALFVADWDTEEPLKNFEDRETMTNEVKSLRAKHNFSTDSAIEDVAKALWKHVDEKELKRVLTNLPQGASDYWRI